MKYAMVVYFMVAYGPAMDFIPKTLCDELAAKNGRFTLELDEDFEAGPHVIPKGSSVAIERVECFDVEAVPCPEDKLCLW